MLNTMNMYLNFFFLIELSSETTMVHRTTISVKNIYELFFFSSSETMSVPTFHYIQVQLFQYYEMIMMEKKEAKVWAKR